MLVAPGVERYEIRRKLGAGGMGVVYEALDRERNTPVALTTLKRMDAVAIQRFKHEFRALSDVSHPDLVSLYELVVEEERVFFTMELVDGVDFIKWVRRDPETADTIREETHSTISLPGMTSPASLDSDGVPRPRAPASSVDNATLDLRRLRSSLADLCEAVAAIHSAGMLHRDLKPSNVLVDDHGRVVVLDFGLITDLEGESSTSSSSDERPRVGTPSYMSPEQGARQALTPASDWYSVGVMLYKALTGRAPFAGGEADVLMDKQQFEPPPPNQIANEVPDDLNALCVELLRRDPEKRPPGKEVLRRVGVQSNETSPGTTRSSLAIDHVLVGRDSHMQQLRDAFEDVRNGETSLVYVHGPSGMGKSALLRRAERDARALSQEGPTYCTASAQMLYAGIASVRGDLDKAAEYLRGAKQGLEETGMQLFLAATNERLGHLIKGNEGADLISASAEYYEREGWRDPQRTTAAMVPGV